MSSETPEWRGPTDKNDDAWTLEFEEIEGEARLYIKKTGLEEYDREAYAVVLYDAVSGNERPVDIDFNPAEAENLIEDWISLQSIGAVRERIIELRGENQ